MTDLWNKEQEQNFFLDAKKFATNEQLFYVAADGSYYAYWPKNYSGQKSTLQSRNSFIGHYTEKWTADLLQDFLQSKDYYIIQGAICDEIGLSPMSPADLAVCRTNSRYQRPEDIKLIIEIKMSIVWNWQLVTNNEEENLICIGDYRTHQGNPGLLRSDTMLKAIGKSINIRVSSIKSAHIPIVVIGNTPITSSYYDKVDHLIMSGVLQGFWSVNPNPFDTSNQLSIGNIGANIKNTDRLGFYRFDTYDELTDRIDQLLQEESEFLSRR